MFTHPSRPVLGAAIALFLSIAAAGSASAATVTVDPGSVGGRCSDSRTAVEAQNPATPWCTLAKGLTAAPDGSTVQLRRGTYAATTVTGRHLVTGISVVPFPGEKPALRSLSMTQSDRFSFTGLTFWAGRFDGCRFITFSADEVINGGVFFLNGASLVVDHTVFHDMVDALVVRRSSAITVTDNVFRDNQHRTTAGGDGIQAADNLGMTIHGNSFLRLSNSLGHSDAIELLGANDNITMDGNLFRATRGLIVTIGAGGTGKQTKHLVITNNEWTQTPTWAINLTNAPGALLVNNTIWAAGHGVQLFGSTRASLYNNIISRLEGITVAVTADDYNLIAAGPIKGAHDKRGDPRFVSLTTPDFHLTAASPAVDAGTALFAPVLDRDGLGRVGAPDMGAYEFHP